jgi:hypothetical protein
MRIVSRDGRHQEARAPRSSPDHAQSRPSVLQIVLPALSRFFVHMRHSQEPEPTQFVFEILDREAEKPTRKVGQLRAWLPREIERLA